MNKQDTIHRKEGTQEAIAETQRMIDNLPKEERGKFVYMLLREAYRAGYNVGREGIGVFGAGLFLISGGVIGYAVKAFIFG